MIIAKHGRYWAVIDTDDFLICLTVYRKGAVEVVRRIAGDTVAETVPIYPERQHFIQRKVFAARFRTNRLRRLPKGSM